MRLSTLVITGFAILFTPVVGYAAGFDIVAYEERTGLVQSFRNGTLEPKVTSVQYGALRDPVYCMVHANEFSCISNAEKVRRSMKFFRTVHVPAYDCASKEDTTKCIAPKKELQTASRW